MKRLFAGVAASFAWLCCAPAQAEQLRATRLGNPTTRFAPPLKTPDDLRAQFRDPRRKPDFTAVWEQWGLDRQAGRPLPRD